MVLEQGEMCSMFPNQKTAETPIFFLLWNIKWIYKINMIFVYDVIS